MSLTPKFKVTGQPTQSVSWLSIVAGLMVLAFFLYIAGNGSLPKYKEILF